MCGYVATAISGGKGGNEFAEDLTLFCKLIAVRIRSGSEVDSIEGVYLLPSGVEESGPRHGGGGGSEKMFRLEPDEFITAVEGRSGKRVDRLQFITNKGRRSDAYGGTGGEAFTVNALHVGGFVGRSGSRLDAIGFLTQAKCP
jgi:Jacalin-like lectin domain